MVVALRDVPIEQLMHVVHFACARFLQASFARDERGEFVFCQLQLRSSRISGTADVPSGPIDRRNSRSVGRALGSRGAPTSRATALPWRVMMISSPASARRTRSGSAARASLIPTCFTLASEVYIRSVHRSTIGSGLPELRRVGVADSSVYRSDPR